VFAFYHWTTSFLGVSLNGGSQPARSRGPPKPLETATSLQVGGVDPRHNNILGYEFPNVNGQAELDPIS